MLYYQIYWHTDGKDELLAILPERRRDPKRINSQSVMNWIGQFMTDLHNVHYVKVTI
jgi:hypothetical protein